MSKKNGKKAVEKTTDKMLRELTAKIKPEATTLRECLKNGKFVGSVKGAFEGSPVVLGGMTEDALMSFIRCVLTMVGHEVFCVPRATSDSAIVRALAEYDAAGSNALLLITRGTRAFLTERLDTVLLAMVESRLAMVV
jgi:hypothetical protein